MKEILFVDEDSEIREMVGALVQEKSLQHMNIRILPALKDAEKSLNEGNVKGMIVDGLIIPPQRLLDFLAIAREKYPELPIAVLVAETDLMVLPNFEDTLIKLKTRFVPKIPAVVEGKVIELFEWCYQQKDGAK